MPIGVVYEAHLVALVNYLTPWCGVPHRFAFVKGLRPPSAVRARTPDKRCALLPLLAMA
jgi:hypothetical protein